MNLPLLIEVAYTRIDFLWIIISHMSQSVIQWMVPIPEFILFLFR